MLDKSIAPHMHLVPFKLLSEHRSSEGMSLSKSVLRPFKRICLRRQLYLKINKEKVGGKKKKINLRLQKFLSSTPSIPIGFYSQKLWRLIFLD